MAPFYTLSVHISVQHAIEKPRVFRSGHLAFFDEICHHTKNSCTPTVLSWIAPRVDEGVGHEVPAPPVEPLDPITLIFTGFQANSDSRNPVRLPGIHRKTCTFRASNFARPQRDTLAGYFLFSPLCLRRLPKCWLVGSQLAHRIRLHPKHHLTAVDAVEEGVLARWKHWRVVGHQFDHIENSRAYHTVCLGSPREPVPAVESE